MIKELTPGKEKEIQQLIQSVFKVNSSPYAEKIYKKPCFVKTGKLPEINGIKFIPMKIGL